MLSNTRCHSIASFRLSIPLFDIFKIESKNGRMKTVDEKKSQNMCYISLNFRRFSVIEKLGVLFFSFIKFQSYWLKTYPYEMLIFAYTNFLRIGEAEVNETCRLFVLIHSLPEINRCFLFPLFFLYQNNLMNWFLKGCNCEQKKFNLILC